MTNIDAKTNSDRFFVYIPNEVLERKDLTQSEKIVFGIIFAGTTSQKYITAGNPLLAKVVGLSAKRISEIISSLTKKKLIKRKIFRDANKRVTKRKLWATIGYEGVSRQIGRGYPDKSESNSVSNNTVSLKTDKHPTNTIGEDTVQSSTPKKAKTTPVTQELPLDPIYAEGFPMYLELSEQDMPQSPDEAKKQMAKYAELEAKGDAKNSLSPCTVEELLTLCAKHRLYYEDVLKKYRDIVELINEGTFQKKYGHKTIYRTLDRWLGMDIQRKYLEPITDQAELNIQFQIPSKDADPPNGTDPYSNHGMLTPERFKYMKMYRDLRERKLNGK